MGILFWSQQYFCLYESLCGSGSNGKSGRKGSNPVIDRSSQFEMSCHLCSRVILLSRVTTIPGNPGILSFTFPGLKMPGISSQIGKKLEFLLTEIREFCYKDSFPRWISKKSILFVQVGLGSQHTGIGHILCTGQTVECSMF